MGRTRSTQFSVEQGLLHLEILNEDRKWKLGVMIHEKCPISYLKRKRRECSQIFPVGVFSDWRILSPSEMGFGKIIDRP